MMSSHLQHMLGGSQKRLAVKIEYYHRGLNIGHEEKHWILVKAHCRIIDDLLQEVRTFYNIDLGSSTEVTLKGYGLFGKESIDILRDGDELDIKVLEDEFGHGNKHQPVSKNSAGKLTDSKRLSPVRRNLGLTFAKDNPFSQKNPKASQAPPGKRPTGHQIKNSEMSSTEEPSSEDESSRSSEKSQANGHQPLTNMRPTSETNNSSSDESSSEESSSLSEDPEESSDLASPSQIKAEKNALDGKTHIDGYMNGHVTRNEIESDSNSEDSDKEPGKNPTPFNPEADVPLDISKPELGAQKISRNARRKRKKRQLIREGILPKPRKRTRFKEKLLGEIRPIHESNLPKRGSSKDPAHANFLATGHIRFTDSDQEIIDHGKIESEEEDGTEIPEDIVTNAKPIGPQDIQALGEDFQDKHIEPEIDKEMNRNMEEDQHTSRHNSGINMAMDAEISDRPKAFYEGLPSMNGPPEAGMQVAYRIVELEDSGPKESEWREGCVSHYDIASDSIEIQPSSSFKQRHQEYLQARGMIDDEEGDFLQDDDSIYDKEGVLRTNLIELSQFRNLIFQDSIIATSQPVSMERNQGALLASSDDQFESEGNKVQTTETQNPQPIGKMGPKIARIKRGNASQISVHGPPVIPKKQASNPNSEQTSPHLEAPISIPRELEPLSGPQKEINLEFNPRKNSLSPEIAAALAARKKELLDTGSKADLAPKFKVTQSQEFPKKVLSEKGSNPKEKGTGGPGAVKARPGVNASALGRFLSVLRETNDLENPNVK